MSFLSGMPAGVRLEMVTDAPWIELDVQLTLLEVNGETAWPPRAVFEAVIDGVAVSEAAAVDGNIIKIDQKSGEMEFVAGSPVTVRLEGWKPGECHLEIWLPHNAMVDVLDMRVPLESRVSASPASRPRWAHYGSSISHCVNVPRPTATWPSLVALRSGVSLNHLGFAGHCHLDGAVARLLRDAPLDALSLKLGINVLCDDTMRERTFVPAVHAFLDVVRDGHPDIPIVVVSPIFCPALEDTPGPVRVDAAGIVEPVPRSTGLDAGALTGRRVRELLIEIVGQRASTDGHLTFIDGRELLGSDEVAGLYDGLHPDEAATQRIGDRFFDLTFGPGGPFRDLASSP
jgi:hypothetical protein